MKTSILSSSAIRNPIARSAGGLVVAACLAIAGCNGSTSNFQGTPNATGPQITAVDYIDVDANGVDAGDVLVVVFDSMVRRNSGTTASFAFESDMDTLGTGAVLTQSVPNSQRVEITLGSGADLVPAVSVLDARTGTNLNIEDLAGDDMRPNDSASPIVDITALPPVLVGSSQADIDLDGTLNQGDTILCEFDKPVSIPGGATFAANFALPVTGDTLGATPTLSAFSVSGANRGVLITLDAAPTLTVTGTFDSAIISGGSPSGIEMGVAPTVTDTLTAMPNPVTASTQVDVAQRVQSTLNTGEKGSLFVGNTDGSSPDVGPNGFAGPGGMVHFEGSVLGSPAVDLFFVADTRNHRVLVFDGLPAGNNGSASVVLGQPDLFSGLPNRSSASGASPTAQTLNSPVDVHFVAATNQLFVSDSGNHRVVVFDGVVNTLTGALTLVDGEPASFVIGQSSLGLGEANQGSTPTSRTLDTPGGIHVEGTQLAVADTGNHRILIWNSVPTSNNAAASIVLGQADFVSNAADGGLGAIDGTVLESPSDVVLDSTVTVNAVAGAVVVADTGNHRVLVWHGTNPAPGAAADRVLGQADFMSDAAGAGAAELDTPTGVEIFPTSVAFTSGDSIFVCDAGNDRVQEFDFSGGLADGAAASGTIGMAGDPADDTLDAPERASLSIGTATFLFVADRLNHRVMQFPVAAGVTGTTASAEQGQPSFSTSMPKGHTANNPTSVVFTGGRMIVCDTENHRVLIYSTTPTAGDPLPDVILGQADEFDTEPNMGLGAPTATSLRSPSGVATDGTRLVVADTGNNRVLIWNSIPATNAVAADIVLGQGGFTAASPNTEGISAATLDSPVSASVSGMELIVCDRDNHRVLVWLDVTSVVNGTAADVVIGQNDFTSRLPNLGSAFPTASSLHTPLDARVVAGLLWVADSRNHRVLGYTSTAASAQAAGLVIGQVDFVRADEGNGLRGMFLPSGLASDGNRFFVADSGNHRVIAYTQVPLQIQAAADDVLGQSSITGRMANRGAVTPSENTLFSPRGMFFDGSTLWTCDEGNSRVVRTR